MDWHNLGLWTDADGHYETAALALATRLGTEAGFGPGQRVLDVGVGAGAQLACWRDQFNLTDITALEPDPVLAARAGAIVANASQLPSTTFDRIVALDCAYHFPDQARFFRAAHERLAPGGRLVFTDLVGVRTRRARVAARLCGIPGPNVRPTTELVGQLESAGFAATVTPLPDVLSGFARHGSPDPRHRVRITATRLLCAALARDLDYVLVTAIR